MVVLGLILLVLCLATGAAVAASNTATTSLEALGYTLTGLTIGGLFLVGMAVGALALVGLSLLLGGARRKRARKAALKHEVREVRSERETLAEENARLQAELEQERSVYPAEGTGSTGGPLGERLETGEHGRGKHGR